MPQVIRVGKFVVMIYVNDHAPAHVHVIVDAASIKIIISTNSVELDSINGKVKANDLRAAMEVVADNLEACLAKWKEIHE